MSVIQSNPGGLLVILAIWLICSVCFCLLLGYLSKRMRQRPRYKPGSQPHPARRGHA